jgi:hypothetical protein
MLFTRLYCRRQVEMPDAVGLARGLRRGRQVEAIWLLGARVVFEVLNEIVRYGLDNLDARPARYAALDQDVIRLVGADRFPPIRLVAEGRR